MVAIRSKLLFCSIYSVISLISCFPFHNTNADSSICEETCTKTYPSHTYEKSTSVGCCERGCRLFSIIELLGEEDGLNGTLKSCQESCREAYNENEEESSACVLGCNGQKPFTEKWEHMLSPSFDLDSGVGDMMYPFLYMHDVYSNMIEKARHHMSVSWSFFMQDGTGRLVVIKSQPHVVDLDQAQDFDDYSLYRGTSAGLETNIEASDNTATEVLKHSQLKAARSLGDAVLVDARAHDSNNSDWLSCIARKTGIPRVLLCILILLSAVVMIWLCMSAAVTSPEHKILQKKSVIKFDLNYLKNLKSKEGFKGIHPQDFIEAHPLPAKLRIEQV